MSHEATNWAIRQRGLKPTAKIVLWHLCDRHNPDYGCFPTQSRLADDAEISVSSLNEHLARLEAAGLIRRLRSHDPHTHRRQATRYILGFEPGFTPVEPEPVPETGDGSAAAKNAGPTPESGTGSISGFPEKPSPDFAQSHLRNPETNLVREPVKEEEVRAGAREDISEKFFGELLRALGLDPDASSLPVWWQGWPPREHIRRWRDDLGLSETAIVAVAKASRRDHPTPPDGPKGLDRAMERAARQAKQPDQGKASSGGSGTGKSRKRKSWDKPHPGGDELAQFYADMVNSERFLPSGMISNSIRNAMLARGLVTAERLRMRGVQ